MSADMPEIDRNRIEALAEYFRHEAEQCCKMAESASSPTVKMEWLRFAEGWRKLAQSALSCRFALRVD